MELCAEKVYSLMLSRTEPHGAESRCHLVFLLSRLGENTCSLFNRFKVWKDIFHCSFEMVLWHQCDFGLFWDIVDGTADSALSQCGLEVLVPFLYVGVFVSPWCHSVVNRFSSSPCFGASLLIWGHELGHTLTGAAFILPWTSSGRRLLAIPQCSFSVSGLYCFRLLFKKNHTKIGILLFCWAVSLL